MKKQLRKDNQNGKSDLEKLEKLLLKDVKKNRGRGPGSQPGLIINRLPIRLLVEVAVIMLLYFINFITGKELIIVLVTVPVIIEILLYFLMKKQNESE